MMKNIVVLFAGGDMTHALTPIHDSITAFSCALAWAKTVLSEDEPVVVLTVSSCREQLLSVCGDAVPDIVVRDSWTNGGIASEIAAACERHSADTAVFAWADCPFLNTALTKELLHIQTAYKAEYSFADGFPYGLAPEIIDRGTAHIVSELAKTSQSAAGGKKAGRDALFSIMSGDINSFEIETHLAKKDYRMLRLSFDCGNKANALGCARLFDAASPDGALSALDVYALCDCAEKNSSVLQTLPAFYNVQLAGRYNHALSYSPYALLCEKRASCGTLPLADMSFDSFSALVADIAATSEQAVVSLSLFGEPLLHPKFAACVAEVLRYPKLSVFIETDGTLVTDELARTIASSSLSASERVIWCVLLDAVHPPMYQTMHGISDSARAEADFAAAIHAVQVLSQYFPHQVYPQFVRTKKNEWELEAFYRFWKKTDSPSLGELVIQKYDSFCQVLPDEKSADLSPLHRFPCWHLRRDFCVLSDGSVPLCKSAAVSSSCSIGNVFEEGISAVWARFTSALEAHIGQSYNEQCKACDEYYTFNF